MSNYYESIPWGEHKSERGFRSRLMFMWNLVDYLDLDENTAESFFPLFNEHTKNRDKLTKRHRELVTQIVDDIEDESVSLSELKDLVKELEEIDISLRKDREMFLKKTKGILDDRQYVKLVIFDDKLKKDLFTRFSSRSYTNRSPMGDVEITQKSRENVFNEMFRKNTESEINKMEEMQKMLEEQQKRIEAQQKEIQKLLEKQ